MRFSLSEHTKIDVGWGFAPDPTGGAYSASQTLYLVSRGPLRDRRDGIEEGRTKEGQEGKGGERGNAEGMEKGEIGDIALVVGV